MLVGLCRLEVLIQLLVQQLLVQRLHHRLLVVVSVTLLLLQVWVVQVVAIHLQRLLDLVCLVKATLVEGTLEQLTTLLVAQVEVQVQGLLVRTVQTLLVGLVGLD